MHFQEIRRAAAQGTISLPPPMDSEGLEDLAVLKSCLKVIRELSEFPLLKMQWLRLLRL